MIWLYKNLSNIAFLENCFGLLVDEGNYFGNGQQYFSSGVNKLVFRLAFNRKRR